MDCASVFPPDRVTVMGVVNLTPDSFSDGGRLVRSGGAVDLGRAIDHAAKLVEAGAHVLDLGGESTRPGAEEVDPALECQRTVPAVAAIAARFDVHVSIDTRKAEVAQEALRAGACIVNDVSGLQFDPGLGAVAAAAEALVVLGHARGTPTDMQSRADYDDVPGEVAREVDASVALAQASGIARERLVIDPGIGFAKRLEANLELLAHVDWLRSRFERPLLVGPARKRFIGELTGDPVEARDAATAEICAVLAFAGVDAVRVHDVASASRAVMLGRTLRDARRKELT